MNWIRKLFTSARRTSGQAPNTTESLTYRVRDTVRAHLDRMRRDTRDARMKAILDDVASRFSECELAIGTMVEQTLSEKQLHTKAIAGGPSATWLVVSAVPRSRGGAASFFGSEYPPGYGGYVNFWLNSQPARQALTMGHTVFAHLLIYADATGGETISIGVGLSPLDLNNRKACPVFVFPEECLTTEDRKLMGV